MEINLNGLTDYVHVKLESETAGYDGVEKKFTGSFIFSLTVPNKIHKIVEVRNTTQIGGDLEKAMNKIGNSLLESLYVTVVQNIPEKV